MGFALLVLLAQGTPVKYTDTEFTLPEGYKPIETERTSNARIFRRVVGAEPGPDIRIGILTIYKELDPKAPPRPEDVARQIGLPASARISATSEAWRKHQVPAIEYRYEGPGISEFGMLVLLPLELRTFVVQVAAPLSLEEEARADLRKTAASAVGDSYWRSGSIPAGFPIALGIIGGPLLLIGWLWGTLSVYKSGERAMGCLCFLFSPAALVYGFIHFDEMKAPCLTHLVGIAFFAASLFLSRYAG